jgi:hypothetical protein
MLVTVSLQFLLLPWPCEGTRSAEVRSFKVFNREVLSMDRPKRCAIERDAARGCAIRRHAFELLTSESSSLCFFIL